MLLESQVFELEFCRNLNANAIGKSIFAHTYTTTYTHTHRHKPFYDTNRSRNWRDAHRHSIYIQYSDWMIACRKSKRKTTKREK